MIFVDESSKVFHLQTEKTSYVLNILPTGHLGHLYYGPVLDAKTKAEDLETRYSIEVGNQVLYDQNDRTFNLNTAMLELSTYGKGDFRDPMLHFRFSDNTSLSDFHVVSHQILKNKPLFPELPESKEEGSTPAETLMVQLRDEARDLDVDLYYSVFSEADVITRRAVIRNGNHQDLTIEKAMSMNLDMPNRDYTFVSLDGAWIRERTVTEHKLEYGILKIDSKKGTSGNDHNPFLAIKEKSTSESMGPCFGFSLVYSGNFEATVEISPHGLLRVLFGIQSFDFRYLLKKGATFVTPEAVLTYSNEGLSKLSQNFHSFIKKNIIPKQWQNRERPVLANNWEATYFDFDERKLIKLAKQAKKLGIELFVLDDGWFGNRSDDFRSLGDWFVNLKKIPSGIDGLAKKINKIGLDFGIWVEPEMVSVESELFRAHPDWAITHPDYSPSFGRNQLILDLTNPDVRNYLFTVLDELLSNANITYVKWDMNRNFSDIHSNYLDADQQASFSHHYMLGLYELLSRLTSKHPDILFESCASGGNRFDLGMLCYMPQTWVSDNTDGVERLFIQYGTSMIYPPSTMGAHVSAIPNMQTIRKVPLETRFNTAAFGLLGYELDLNALTPYEKKVIRKQVDFYKKHRETFQYGTFRRYKSPFESNQCVWGATSEDKNDSVLGVYTIKETPNGGLERFQSSDLDPKSTYHVTNRPQYFNLDQFGHLVKHALPIRLNAEGIPFHLLKNRYLMPVEQEDMHLRGDLLSGHGFAPKQNFIGSGYNENVRLMGDYGSRIYLFEKESEDQHAS